MKCNDEIRQANRKALPKFILLVALGAAVGGVLGYLAAEHGLEGLSGILRRAGLAFGQWAAPWLLLALAVAVLALGTGILPSLVVCLIWLVNLCVYCGESLRLSRSGVRIS